MDDKLKSLLISRALRSRPSEDMTDGLGSSLLLSRRQFLVGVSATGAVASVSKIAASAPRVSVRGRAIMVSYSGATWEIDPARFGTAAEASWGRLGDTFSFVLRNAQLPGTDLDVSFNARITREPTNWQLHLSMPALDFDAEMALGPWILGESRLRSYISVRRMILGGGSVKALGKKVELLMSPAFEFELGCSDSQIKLLGPELCNGDCLFLCPRPAGNKTFHDAFGDFGNGPVTIFSVGGVCDVKPIPLGVHPRIGEINFEPRYFQGCSGEAYNDGSSCRSLVLIEGEGAFTLCPTVSGAATRIQLENSSLLLTSGHEEANAAIGGRIARVAHSLDLGSLVATIEGDDAQPLYARFRAGLSDSIRIQGKLHSLNLPIEDADFARLEMPASPVEILLPGGASHSVRNELAAARAKQAESGSSFIVLGNEPIALVSLEGSKVNIRRGVDLFNLSFIFEGFDLRVRHGSPVLERRRPKQNGQAFPPATVTVLFPPQHIAEEWFPVQDPSACMTNPPCFPTVTRARLSGPSSVVFSLDPDPTKAVWKSRKLTIDSLTEWSELALVVDSRALPVDSTFETQMKELGITADTRLFEAGDKIRASLKPPGRDKTQLELVGRLLFSPSRESNWNTPRGVNTSVAPLWHARLDNAGRNSLRAIWSRYMLPGSFEFCTEPSDNVPFKCEPNIRKQASDRLLILQSNDHWNLVGQSSVYGLPARRRIIDKPNGGPVADPVEDALKKLPRSRVVRPTGPDGSSDYRMLLEIDKRETFQNKDSGIAVPVPFSDADVILTGLGGIVTADWLGEPPSLLEIKDGKANPLGFDLERFSFRLFIGREIRVETVKKGYLLPLGVRASFLQLSERLFFRHPRFGTPYAYVVQRSFIVVQKPIKRLPGVNQPYLSRDFPAERIVMLTKVSPDLDAPVKVKTTTPLAVLPGGVEVREGGRLTFPFQNSDILKTIDIFWPRVAEGLPGTPGDVDFKWTLDDDTTEISSNLLFVSNSAIGFKDLMAQVVRFYRALGPAGVNGAVVSASSTTSGDAKNLLDDDDSTTWAADSSPIAHVVFDLVTAKRIYSISLTADAIPNRAPKDFTLAASNSGAFAGEQVAAVNVESAPNWSATESRNYKISSPGVFRYYRLTMTNTEAGAGGYRLSGVDLCEAHYDGLRRARMFGARRRYAPTETDGDTTFDTESWMLSARGPFVKNAQGQEIEDFFMDGLMEGGDQPPCYPIMENARLNVQSLDRLIGRPQGLITVAFNPEYVTGGFGPPLNPSEIYLNFLGPNIELNVTGQSTATGGIAQPNALAVALSRKIGIVGGKQKSATQLNSKRSAPTSRRSAEVRTFDIQNVQRDQTLTLVGPPSPSPYSFEKAQSGQFDGSEFLGAITKAKILGLIDLGQLLKIVSIDFAPKLVETLGYGALGPAKGALDRIKALLFSGPAIGNRLKEGLDFIQGVIDKPVPYLNGKIYFQDVYPVLYARFSALKAAVDDGLDRIKNATNLSSIANDVSQIVITGRPFLAELERTLHDPVPPLIRNLINQFAGLWVDLRNLVNSSFLNIGREMVSILVQTAIRPICEEIDKAKLSSILLGADPGVTCNQIIADPMGSLGGIGRSLFEDVLAAQIQRLLTVLRGYECQVTAKLIWAEQAISQAVLAIIVQTSEQLRNQLIQPLDDSDPKNILARPAREALRDAVIKSSSSALAPILAGKIDATSVEDVRAALESSAASLPAAIAQVRAGINVAIDSQRGAFQARVASDLDEIIKSYRAGTVDQIAETIQSNLTASINALRAELITQVQQTRAQAIKRIGETAAEVFRTLAASTLYARVAQAGRAAQNWCDSGATQLGSAKVIAFADDIANRLLAPATTLSADLTDLLKSANKLQPPSGLPPDSVRKFDAAKRAIKAAIQQLALAAQAIQNGRDELNSARNDVTSACRQVDKFLEPTQRLIQLQGQAIARIQDVVAKILEIEELLAGVQLSARIKAKSSGAVFVPTVRSTGDVASVIQEMVGEISRLVKGFSGIGQVGQSTAWNEIKATVDAINNPANADFQQLRSIPGYTAKLVELSNTLMTTANGLRQSLDDPNITATSLRNLGEGAASYVRQTEKRFVGFVLQSVTLLADQALRLGKAATVGLSNLAKILVAFHIQAEAALNVLYTALNGPQVKPILALVLADPDSLTEFKKGIDAVSDDRVSLQGIENARNDPVDAFTKTQALLDRWYPPDQSAPGPALVSILSSFAALIESLLRGELGDILTRLDIKTKLQAILNDLRDAISQLLPTRVDLHYTWKTSLGKFPSGNYVFSMSGDETPEDLSIRANVSVDFISGARTAEIIGTIKPFEIWLVTANIDIAKIKFLTSTFRSVNGSAPTFDPKIDTVVLGKLMEFIKPLQAWLSPSDSGFYIKLMTSPIGLEVGYIYDAGIILVGTLQFINVALGASARLPFNGDEAEFEFHFASQEKPFLIAQPPYGGGGHIQLIANASSIKGFSLSFHFGAVVAIKFGPLKAQGRVNAGVFLAIRAEGGRTIAAFIEAAGEGNIACFSICVFIQVGLVQEVQDGRSVLYGFSIYKFSFKVGFVSIKISFTATYTIQGDRNSQAAATRLAKNVSPCVPLICIEPPGADALPRYSTISPRKASQWGRYRDRIAMHLLS
jgi:hypothetical protein